MMSSERTAVGSMDLDDLDLVALERFLVERAPSLVSAVGRDDAAIRLGLLAKMSPRLVPTLVGGYVFGKTPQYVFPEWGLGCVALNGHTLADPVARKADLEGPLHVLVEKALEFVGDESRSDDREPSGDAQAPYAREIVREAVVNALVHRDLRRPSRVVLRVFSDRLEVQSPGGPPEGLSDLEEAAREGGVSVPRNPLLASIARHLGLGEQLGRGLLRIVLEGATGRRVSSGDEVALEERVEIRTSPREVLLSLPARWRRPTNAASLS
jgi:predicted HTH transcriptional regulator